MVVYGEGSIHNSTNESNNSEEKKQGESAVTTKSAGAIPSMQRHGAAAGAMQILQQPSFEPRTYQILIKNNRFEPEILKIEKGSIVEWRVMSCSSSSPLSDDDRQAESFSSIRDQQLRHVIAFESVALS